ncbi:380_t:CDS:1, partial [Scutellospora calospora]
NIEINIFDKILNFNGQLQTTEEINNLTRAKTETDKFSNSEELYPLTKE